MRLEPLEEYGERLLGIVRLLAQDGDAPSVKHGFLDRISLRHENKGARPILLIVGAMPSLPELVQQKPDVHVGQTIADEQYSSCERIGAELHIERRIE